VRVAGQSAGRGAIRGRAARGGGVQCSLASVRLGEGARSAMAETIADTRRLISKPQNLNDAYGPPSNFLEIDVGNPQTVGVGRGRFTTYEIRVKVRARHGPARLGGERRRARGLRVAAGAPAGSGAAGRGVPGGGGEGPWLSCPSGPAWQPGR